MTDRPVTISYIARSAGVSVPTVSKVLNGRAGVSDDTRARVEALILRYGYRRAAPSTRTRTVELVYDEMRHMWGTEIIRGVERAARAHRVGVVLTEFGPERNAIHYWIDDTVARRPDAVVSVAQLTAEQREQLRARGIPFVVLDPTAELPDGVPFVGATNWSGGRSATAHLIRLGHRRIAIVSGPRDVLCCRARLDGHRAAMDAAGLPVPPASVLHRPLTVEAGHEAALRLLTGRVHRAAAGPDDDRAPGADRRATGADDRGAGIRGGDRTAEADDRAGAADGDRTAGADGRKTGTGDRPTAIVTGNDLQAVGVYRAARDLGLRVPDDLSVVGFDDLPVAALVEPPLTTVHQPLAEMATAATELALALGRGEPDTQPGLELATTLTIRGSTAAPS
ncbi:MULTISPECIES: LacI family DNA-binding transcriptional regulator [Catenuloplanes]|uniref:DNA-binding LacI/PurR family transcriptional regulator n=1 Tax=Catenuloplanes niger TaxID=587534 RepID=A0AAE3ZX43_9ACTN|nr:LacI family DNA-binding transcriptional regulator [Catenuloplanes niger]MDR7327436.1 DNA-binding LacI/PurR family transcriptional regulator [Catenuloplanes niger]